MLEEIEEVLEVDFVVEGEEEELEVEEEVEELSLEVFLSIKLEMKSMDCCF